MILLVVMDQTGSGGFTDGSSWPTGSRPEYGSDDFINSPKRTKWVQ